MKQVLVYITLITFLILLNNPSVKSQNQYHYPIIFVHGLVGSDNTFKETLAFLSEEQDFGQINVFDVLLNADNNSETANLQHDVKWEDFIFDADTVFLGRRNNAVDLDDFVDEWNGNNLFAVNFKEERIRGAYDLINTQFKQSNEAAIFKQGFALSKMIAEVLDFTQAEKVILVGHSMGGLAIREYLQRTDENGLHPYWMNPNEPDGHKVAKVVTFGTPHLGSNTSPDPTKSLIPSATGNSEANRDMLWEYNEYTFCDDSLKQGIYLFGGYEQCIAGEDGFFGNSTFDNVDVNCDGDEDDWIVGINEAFNSKTYNPEMPLPDNIRYTYITSIWVDWNSNIIGDGAVDIERQWLRQNDIPTPVGCADTLMSNVFHSIEPADYQTIIRGMDEPAQFAFSYGISLMDTVTAHVTLGQNASFIDTDMFYFNASDVSAISIHLNDTAQMIDSIRLFDKNFNPLFASSNNDSLFIELLSPLADTVYIAFYSTASVNSWKNTYQFCIKHENPTGQQPFFKQMNSIVYPNPAFSQIDIEIFEYQTAQLVIFDVSGRLLYQSMLHRQNKINIEHLKNGVYILKIQFVDDSDTHKLLKFN